MIKFTVYGTPIPQPRPKVSTVNGMARAYVPAKHPIHAWRDSIAAAYPGEKLEGALQMRVYFFMPRPKAKLWKTKPMPAYMHTGSIDIDNLFKSIGDALNGIAYQDDGQICDLRVGKMVCSGYEQPRAEIYIKRLEE